MKTISSDPTIVLKHAAWADESSWSAAIGQIPKLSIKFIAARIPIIALSGYGGFRGLRRLVVGAMVLSLGLEAGAQEKKDIGGEHEGKEVVGAKMVAPLMGGPEEDSLTDGSVTVGGQAIAYRAVAGTLTVGSTDVQDAMLGMNGQALPDAGTNPTDRMKSEEAPATAKIFYVAYFKKDATKKRPVTFLYNGGPGSATMWLHMGSFGPRRVVTPDGEHQEGAPYTIVNNDDSLLDVSDLVFIDAPGTGFSRIMGKDKVKAFGGTDKDAHAFDRFIRRFLTKYDRWNSPKYLFGESFGTPRSAVLSADLQQVDLNGIILLSQILSFDNTVDGPEWNPGVDQSYALALPTYAASALFHHKLPSQPVEMQPFLEEVEKFALGEYMAALLQGSELPEKQRQAVAEKLHGYTGLPVEYLLRADLRVNAGEFTKTLALSDDTTIGRLDTRYEGPSVDPLSQKAAYDPLETAIASAYTAAINAYVRNDLKYGANLTYKPGVYDDPDFVWDLRHHAPGGPLATQQWGATNVMPDLAYTMKMNPKMKVMLAGGYFDLATPFFEGMYEMHHLPIPRNLQSNISYHYYQSGHMVYVNKDVLKHFHADVAAFIRETEGGK